MAGLCEGRVCIVTGAGRGIGRDYALMLAAEGALLALAAGWWGLREVLRRPVVETLRRAAQ